MEKYYLVFDFAVPDEYRDIADGIFFESGCKGVEDLKHENGVSYLRVYFDADSGFSLDSTPLKEFLLNSFRIEEESWNENWKKHFKPVEIGKSIIVVPSWLKDGFDSKGRTPIFIYPGQTFGTGTHESTKLIMELMEDYLFSGCSFLDVGSGSGILSILAKKLGASKIVGCDIQKEAKDEIEFNSIINGVSGIDFVLGSVDNVDGSFDIVTANIEKHLLFPILPKVIEKAEKIVLLSGILESQENDLERELVGCNVSINSMKRENGWTAFAIEK